MLFFKKIILKTFGLLELNAYSCKIKSQKIDLRREQIN